MEEYAKDVALLAVPLILLGIAIGLGAEWWARKMRRGAKEDVPSPRPRQFLYGPGGVWEDGKVANFEALAAYALAISYEGIIWVTQDDGVDISAACTPAFLEHLRELLLSQRVLTPVQVDDAPDALLYVEEG